MAVPTVGDAVATRVLADAAVTALIGTRFAPSKPTQEPAGDHATYWAQGGGEGITLSGPTAYKWHNVRVEATSTTQAGAEAIMDAIAASLHGWRDVTAGVQGCIAQDDRDEATLEDGRQVSGQTFAVRFKPVP